MDYDSVARTVRVVEVHQAGDGAGPLWYRVGTLYPGDYGIAWEASHPYDNGENPHVSLSGGTVVEVHQAGDGVGPLWYRVGDLGSDSITWGGSSQYEAMAENPSVSQWNGDVVTVQQAADGTGPLWYRVGSVEEGGIQWAMSYQYDNGANPSVSISPSYFYFADEYVVELHQLVDGPSPQWYRGGKLHIDSTIEWSPLDQFLHPSVSMDRSIGAHLAVEVHEAGDGNLIYRVGELLQW